MTTQPVHVRGNDRPIEVDHTLLLQMLGRLERALEGAKLAQLLDELHGYLGKHFAAEERRGGFFESVTRLAPRHAGVVDGLRREHHAMLEELVELRRELSASSEPVDAAVMKRIRALAAALREHESVEGELLQDTFDTDIPPGD
jgi:hemerythrin